MSSTPTPKARARRSRESPALAGERAAAGSRGDPRRAAGRQRPARPDDGRLAAARQEPRLPVRPHLEGRDRLRQPRGGRSICRSSATTCTTCSSCSTSPIPAVPSGDRATTTVAPQALFMMNSDLVHAGRATIWPAAAARAEPATTPAAIARLYAAGLRPRRHGRRDGRADRRSSAVSSRRWRAGEPDAAKRRRQAWAVLCQAVAGGERVHVCRIDDRERGLAVRRHARLRASDLAPRRCCGQIGRRLRLRWRWPSLLAEESRGRRAARPIRSRRSRRTSRPRAKRVIFLFMNGGPSQVDTFDLQAAACTRDDGKPLPVRQAARAVRRDRQPARARPGSSSSTAQSGALGQRAVSRTWPSCVDDLCFIHSVHGTNPAHGGALLKLHTGSDNFVRPSMGSWVTYGLGTENRNLPGFVTICPTLAHGGVQQLELGLPAGRLPGHAARQRQRPVRPGAGAVHRQRRDCRATCSGCSSTCWPR